MLPEIKEILLEWFEDETLVSRMEADLKIDPELLTSKYDDEILMAIKDCRSFYCANNYQSVDGRRKYSAEIGKQFTTPLSLKGKGWVRTTPSMRGGVHKIWNFKKIK